MEEGNTQRSPRGNIRRSPQKRETSKERDERLARELKQYLSEKQSKAERFASEYEKSKRESKQEKEEKTIQKLSDLVKKDPKILTEIQSYRRQLIGKSPKVVSKPKVVVLPPISQSSEKSSKQEIAYSDEAQKIFNVLSPYMKYFMYENPFSDEVKIALYRYLILFLYGDPNVVIQEAGKIFNENLKQNMIVILDQIQDQIKTLEKEVASHMSKYQSSRTFGGPILTKELQVATQKKKEIARLREIGRMFILNDKNTIKDFIIKEIGKENFEQFVYFIAAYFYDPDTGIEYLKPRAKWSAEKKRIEKEKAEKEKREKEEK